MNTEYEDKGYAKKITAILDSVELSDSVSERLLLARKTAVSRKKVESVGLGKLLDFSWLKINHLGLKQAFAFTVTAFFVSSVLLVADSENESVYEENMQIISDYATMSDIFELDLEEFDFSDSVEDV